MTRIIVEKDGIVTDVPENEAVNYLRKGYVKTGTLPDALPEKDQKSTPEQAAVMVAALKVAEAENELTKAENANDVARNSTLVDVQAVAPAPKKASKGGA